MNIRNHLRNLFLSFSLLAACGAWAQSTVTNKDLIQMGKLGMGDAIIISQIESSTNDFDVTTPALLEMKKAGLSDTVIAKVIAAANDESKKVVDQNDPMAPHRPGIYYFDDSGKMVELLPTISAQTKSKGHLAQAFSYGFAKATTVASLSGSNARLQLPSAREFYFYFNQQNSTFNQNAIPFYGFQQASSPNEFTLAKLDEKAGSRELEVGGYSALGGSSGIHEKHTRPFAIEQIAPGVFKVTPDALANGEYGFVYTGPTAHGMERVFDFGVGHVSGGGTISKQ